MTLFIARIARKNITVSKHLRQIQEHYQLLGSENILKLKREGKQGNMFSYACIGNDKKVLLRERKRDTARRVASARYAALSHGWEGTSDTPPESRPGQG